MMKPFKASGMSLERNAVGIVAGAIMQPKNLLLNPIQKVASLSQKIQTD
jgi:hypothetical protein